MDVMYVCKHENTQVFINSSVVYKLWWGGRGGVRGLEHRLKSPHPPPPLRLGYGSTDLRMSCVTVIVLCGFSFTKNGPQITIF